MDAAAKRMPSCIVDRLGCGAVLWLLLLLSAGSSDAGVVPAIAFSNVPDFGTTDDLQGLVSGVTFTQHHVAVYIYVGGWYNKPTFGQPTVPIQPDGSWTADITTGGYDPCATEIAAFLLSISNAPPLVNGAASLPSELEALSLASVSTSRPGRTVFFSGYTWLLKDSCGVAVGPGPNYFSGSTNNVWLDAQGRCHLAIRFQNGRWECPELISQKSFGYGTYRFFIDGNADAIDPNATLGLFTWSDDPAFNHREVDIELARWGNAADTNNAQFVVQPYGTPGNLARYRTPDDLEASTHSFTWLSNSVVGAVHAGVYDYLTNTSAIIEWTYGGSDVPEHGDENARMNFWLINGDPPQSGTKEEVILRRFQFIPAPVPPPELSPASASADTSRVFQVQSTEQLVHWIQRSTNLLQWWNIDSNLASASTFEFHDRQATASARAFYRVAVPEQ